MKTIGISAKITSDDALQFAAKAAADLRARDFGVCLDFATADKLNDRGKCVAKGDLGKHSDLLITFGGDGTLLSVARNAPKSVPILGVNMGTLGFLTEVRVEEFPEVIELVLAGNYESEERVALEVAVRGPGRDHRIYRVLNDATINKSALARIIEMRVTVGGEFVSSFRADGLIIATPTGSTAYNLSAGGPIIYPTMGAVVLTPICPHMLSNRPVVLPDTLDIEIGIATPNQEIFLTLDGQEGLPIAQNDTVCINKSPNPVTLIRTPHKSYFDVLRAKLKWGEG
ncbi:MAG TPA: NAD(+)/NADH kinase [Thermoanaerobaculia bacterium]|nr:NAD(+)/NADH kinase [Thermoanaerobaculia bacterium]